MKLIKLIESVYKLVDELKLTAKLYFSKCTCTTNLLFLAGTKHPCCDHDFDSHVHTYIENLADNGLSQDEGGSISHCPIFAMCVPAWCPLQRGSTTQCNKCPMPTYTVLVK